MGNSIAALAAGYRPCLVCRPDRLPEIGLDQPDPEIAHAVRLIAEGFLDNANTVQLAERVGYSPRHLVRLFEKHIGASPDFVARARRAHLARRLLDESDLSITNIAFASGFSSLRQMNRVMRELFGFSPSELRAKRSRKDTLDPLDGGLRLRIPIDGTLDGQKMIEYFAARAIPGIEMVEDGCYRRTMRTCGFPGVVEVRAPNDRNHLEVTMHLATFGSIIDQVESVRSLFGVNRYDADAINVLRKDKLLGPIMRKQTGFRLPGAWDRFETAVRIIVGQQVSVAGASTLTGRLVERFGERIDVPLPGPLQYLFPTPAELSLADVRDLGMPQARANTIKRFAAAVASGEVDLTSTASLEQVVANLESLPGIGPWTSHLIAGRVMGHQDAFPASDLGLRKSVAQLVGKTDPVSVSEITEISNRWRPYRSTAAACLWISEINPKLNGKLRSPEQSSSFCQL